MFLDDRFARRRPAQRVRNSLSGLHGPPQGTGARSDSDLPVGLLLLILLTSGWLSPRWTIEPALRMVSALDQVTLFQVIIHLHNIILYLYESNVIFSVKIAPFWSDKPFRTKKSSSSIIMPWVYESVADPRCPTFTDTSDSEDGWSEWSAWSPCSVECGTGEQSRVRTCQGDSRDCKGPAQLSRTCNTQPCRGNWFIFSFDLNLIVYPISNVIIWSVYVSHQLMCTLLSLGQFWKIQFFPNNGFTLILKTSKEACLINVKRNIPMTYLFYYNEGFLWN